nr:thymosin beta-10-like [Arvicanthis niloticus]
MADKFDMGEITSFQKSKLTKTEMQERYIQPSKETAEQANWSKMS